MISADRSNRQKRDLRQQRIQLLQLRCQLERTMLVHQAQEVKTKLAHWDGIIERVARWKPSPVLIAGLTVAVLIIKPKRLAKGLAFGAGKGLKLGLRAWGLWQSLQRYAPLWQSISTRFKQSSHEPS